MPHPLLCWDIVLEGMERRMEFAKDIAALKKLMKAKDWHPFLNWSPDTSLIWENKTILVTGTDLKIELATKNIYQMNGYQPAEVIGRSPRMFQGKDTSLEMRKEIKIAIENQLPFQSSIINYRKDRSLYTCNIEAYPVFNSQQKLVNFIAFENAA